MISLSDRNPYEVHAELMQRIERLEAEVERLKAQLEITQEYGRTIYASAEKYQGQRDELRAENERLTEKLKATTLDSLTLTEDNERLRAALEKIEAGYGQGLSAAELASIARQTL